MTPGPQQYCRARNTQPCSGPAAIPLPLLLNYAIRKPSPKGHHDDIGDKWRGPPKARIRYCDAADFHQVDKKPGKEDVEGVYKAEMGDHECPHGGGGKNRAPRNVDPS